MSLTVAPASEFQSTPELFTLQLQREIIYHKVYFSKRDECVISNYFDMKEKKKQ